MTLTDEQEARLVFLLDTLEDHRNRLTEWELGFLDDHVKRYDQYQSEIKLSPKQWAVLNRMYEKVTS